MNKGVLQVSNTDLLQSLSNVLIILVRGKDEFDDDEMLKTIVVLSNAVAVLSEIVLRERDDAATD